MLPSSSSSSSSAVLSKKMKYVFIDDHDGLRMAIRSLSASSMLAFDTEGVNLSRKPGSLTVVSFMSMDALFLNEESPVAYVIDVQALGGDVVFASCSPSQQSVSVSSPSLQKQAHAEKQTIRSLLEDPHLLKVTFDCRRDSEALFHQFQVTLRGVLELQVLDQAVRIQKGEAPPPKAKQLS
jgi:hypothetical protein